MSAGGRLQHFIVQQSFCESSEPWQFDLLGACAPAGQRPLPIPILPGLGVGELRVEVAKAYPFDPNAFLPM